MTHRFSLLAGIVLMAALAIAAFSTFSQVHANAYTATHIESATTTTSVALTSSQRILASSTSPYTRVYATICNPNATLVYVRLGNDRPATSASSTVVIAAAAGYSSCYEITDRNSYQGSITASSSAGSVTIFASDFWQ